MDSRLGRRLRGVHRGRARFPTELPWRDGGGFSPPQRLEHAQHVLLGQNALALHQLYQRRDLSHVGDGQLFEGHEVGGVEFYSRARTRRVRTLG